MNNIVKSYIVDEHGAIRDVIIDYKTYQKIAKMMGLDLTKAEEKHELLCLSETTFSKDWLNDKEDEVWKDL